MRAVVMRKGRLEVDRVPDPEPGPGEVLVRTLSCGICGSDLHAVQHAEKLVAAARDSGLPAFLFDPARDVVLGHEFCAEVVDYGSGTARRLAPGTRVVSMPLLFRGARLEGVGFSNEVPGGYGERMVLSEPLLLPVPDTLSTTHAALTEPLAVGLHAVAKAALTESDAPLVVGCGPVGLAVIAALRLRGVAPIVASESAPLRRRLAEQLGAHRVLDPRREAAERVWRELSPDRLCVVFECVGAPGLLDALMGAAPRETRVIVAGVCMEEDRIRPMVGINKELVLQFVLGYTPEEFAEALAVLTEGRVAVDPLVTRRVGLDEVPAAFSALAHPEREGKILVEPARH